MHNEITELSFDEIEAINGAGLFGFLGSVFGAVGDAFSEVFRFPIYINGYEISDGIPNSQQ